MNYANIIFNCVTHLYLKISQDCLKEEGRVATAGGEVFKKKIAIGDQGFMSMCKDSEGNMFELHSMK